MTEQLAPAPPTTQRQRARERQYESMNACERVSLWGFARASVTEQPFLR